MITEFKYFLLASAVGVAVIADGNAVIATGNASALAADLVQIDGSSTVFPLTKAMADKLQKVEKAKMGTYQPLSRPIVIYVSKKSTETKPHVNRLVEFYLDNNNAQALIEEVGYVALPVAGLQHGHGQVQ